MKKEKHIYIYIYTHTQVLKYSQYDQEGDEMYSVFHTFNTLDILSSLILSTKFKQIFLKSHPLLGLCKKNSEPAYV